MKTPKEAFRLLEVQMNREYSLKAMAKIQADALRHAIETLSGMLAYETKHMRKSVADCIEAEAKEIEGSPTK